MKRILVTIMILVAIGSAQAAWYDTNYTYYKPITINHTYVNGTVTNHTLLINITDTDLRDKAQSDGDDIIFVNAANDAQLDHQIESTFNTTTGHLVAWIRVPSITNTSDTTINMYYNYSGATNSENPSGVWGENASSVWLMDEGTGTLVNDSSGNSNNGSANHMADPPTATSGWNDSGVVDGCLLFNGTDNYVIEHAQLVQSYPFTMSAWFKTSAASGIIFSMVDKSTDDVMYAIGITSSKARIIARNTAFFDAMSTGTYADENWHYMVGVFIDNTNKELYVDGINVASLTNSVTYTTNVDQFDVGRLGDLTPSSFYDGAVDNVIAYDIALTQNQIATTYNNTNDPTTFSTVGTEQSQYGTPDPINLDHTKDTTWVNHTWDAGSGNVTDSYNVSINDTWNNGTTNEYYNNTPIPGGNWSNITVWAWNSTYSELSAGSVSEDVQTGAAPNITSYAPTVTIWPEVQDSQLFNVTVDQSTQCRWYINGTLTQTNATPSLTHAYTNTSLEGGGCNVTAVVNNTNGSDTQEWIFEVGADSVTWIVLKDQPTNQTLIAEWNVTRIGSNITDWGYWQNHTFSGWTYYFRFTNGTEIMNQTAASNNESLWFNGTSLSPLGVYFLNATSDTNEIILYANEYGLLNNWTTDQTYQHVDNNITNAVCFSYYNSTSGLWEAYRSGYTYNANAVIPKNCSVFIFVDVQTTVSATPHTGGVTIQNATWFYGMLPETTAKTLTEIETEMDADGLDVWSLYGWSNSSQAYTVTGGYSVAPNEGYAVYVNTTGEYTP